ncbi:MAG: gliding motility-associated C-terminal domain-containing protein [Saprospiraceae bacterium]
MKYLLSFTVILFSLVINLNGQCAYNGSFEIVDQDTSSLFITVSDMANNDLATNNCLKEVKIHFKHPYVGDLTMALVSPSGQKVNLVGPVGNDFALTDLFFGWNVTFVESTVIAVPDLDYDQIWNNDQSWLLQYPYTGTYYPNTGDLEDFNFGSVNGVWTIEAIDHQLFDVGEILKFELVFCETEGQVCKTCDLVSHTLIEENIVGCEGDDFDLDIQPNLEIAFDNTLYKYEYVVFLEDTIFDFIAETDMTGYSIGTYTLCGLLYRESDLQLILDTEWSANNTNLNSAFNDNNICASISEDCIEIQIVPLPTLGSENIKICKGESVVIGNQTFDSTGDYDILTSMQPCDSMSVLHLTVIDVTFDFDKSDDELSCLINTLTIDASGSIFPNESVLLWTNNDGAIITDPSNNIITVNQPGEYILQVDVDGCIFSESILIESAADYITASLSASALSCTSDSVIIMLETSDEVESAIWSSTADFHIIDNNIKVGSAGTYSVLLTTANGCTISKEIEIENNSVFPVFALTPGAIDCNTDQVTISTTSPDIYNSTFQWYGDEGNLGTSISQQVSSSGIYYLIVTTQEGCIDTFSTTVSNEVDDFDIVIFKEDLSCSKLESQLTFTSSFAGLNPIWTLPDNSLAFDPVLVVSEPGNYNLHLQNDNNCTLDTTIIIEQDSLLPDVSIEGGMFLCGQDSIQLEASSSVSGTTYFWYGSGIYTTVSNPYIYTAGLYIVRGCAPNGCCAYDTIIITADLDIPTLEFTTQNSNCNLDSTIIIPHNTLYDLEWTFNDVLFINPSNEVRNTEAGIYTVKVTDLNNGCFTKYFFNFSGDYHNELGSLTSDKLDCATSEVRLDLVYYRDMVDYQWSGPGLLDTDVQPMVDKPGKYVIDFEFSNGCTGSDSIIVIQEGIFPNLMGKDSMITCTTDTIDISVSYTGDMVNVFWEGPNFTGTGSTINVSQGGTYTAYATSPGNCNDTLDIIIEGDIDAPVISLVSDSELTCVDSLIKITATVDNNTETYTFDGIGIVDQSDLIANVNMVGTYTLTATAANGCSSISTIEVLNKTALPDYSMLLDSLDCVTDTILVGFQSSDSGIDVVWDSPTPIPNGTSSFNATTTGSYKFSIINEYGCVITDSFDVFLDTIVPNGSLTLSNQITCTYEEADFGITSFDPNWDINWTGPGVVNADDFSFTTDVVGSYKLELVGKNGCKKQDVVLLEYDTTKASINILGDEITCTTGKVFLSLDTDIEIVDYNWTGIDFQSTEAEPLVAIEGLYHVIAQAHNGCISSDEIFIEDSRMYPTIQVDDFYLPCDGAPAQVTYSDISQDAQARWLGSTYYFEGDTALVFSPGEYYGIATNPEGCITTDTFLIIDEPVAPIFNADAEELLCFGEVDITALEIEDDRSHYWTGPESYFSDTNPTKTDIPGTYTLFVTGTNGCIDSIDIEVLDHRIYPIAVAKKSKNFQCLINEVDLFGEGSSFGSDFTYQWMTIEGQLVDDSTSLNTIAIEEGSYVLNVTDNSNGCMSADTIIVYHEPQSLVGLNIDGIRPTCEGYENGVIDILNTIGGFSPFNINVDGEDYGERMEINYLDIGDHLIVVTDSLGCTYDTIVTLDGNHFLEVDITEDIRLDFGDSLTVFADINFSSDSISSIIWSSNVDCEGCTEFTIYPTNNQTIKLSVTDVNGCIVYEEISIKVDRPNPLPFPQIFSPNGDDVNDVFYMPMTKGIKSIDLIKIYDTWGNILYENTSIIPGDPNSGWKGDFKGQPAGQAVYSVLSVVTMMDDSKVNYLGTLTLIR